jgi:hypothetical protein
MGDRAGARRVAPRIRKDRRDGVAGGRFDPHMPRARGEAEHQQHVWFVTRDQARQLFVDRRVARLEDVQDASRVGERRMPQARGVCGQRCAWIARGAGKAAESGDQYGEGHRAQRASAAKRRATLAQDDAKRICADRPRWGAAGEGSRPEISARGTCAGAGR